MTRVATRAIRGRADILAGLPWSRLRVSRRLVIRRDRREPP